MLLLDPYSLVVNAEMAPGFHILVYAKTDQASVYFFFALAPFLPITEPLPCHILQRGRRNMDA